MSRAITARSASFAALVAAASLMLVGCSAGFDATTTEPYPPADGLEATSGGIKVLNALVVAPETGTTGVVSMTIVNNDTQNDRLTSLDSDGGPVDLTGPRVLPAGEAVAFGAGSVPSATIQDLNVQPGQAITLKLSFQRARPIRLRTVVVPATGPYASVTPPPQPVVTESATGSPAVTESPSPSAS